jgi:hypothetical protein
LDQIIPLVREFNEKLMTLVWRSRVGNTSASIFTSRTSLYVPSIGSDVQLNEKSSLPEPLPTLGTTKPPEADKVSVKKTRKCWGWRLGSKEEKATKGEDPEKGKDPREARPVRLFAPFYAGFGFGLAICE